MTVELTYFCNDFVHCQRSKVAQMLSEIHSFCETNLMSL